ncbi:MAG: glycosyltransferase family 4 protein [Alphaproteobacteria bacterium]|nr:glycosyltransferase family 4 protein [Alphaproteobacteria bacterium]
MAPGQAGTPVLTMFHVFPSFGIGGAQIRFAQLANHFGARHRHLVLAIDGDYGTAALLREEVSLTRLEAGFPKERALWHLPAMRRLMTASRADILVTYNWGSIEWALANRWLPAIPRHVHFEDGFGPEEANRQVPRRVWFRRLALGGGHTRVIVPSRVLEGLALRHWRLAREQVIYLPNGIDLTRFSAAGERRSAESVIGTIARLRPEKNLRRLIDAFATLAEPPELRLLLVGDGAEREALTRQARALGLGDRVRFHGATDRPEALLREMDIFALSSDTEQMPISLIEAMASGLPVASTDVGDVVNMLPEENAALVRGCKDTASLAVQLRRLAEDRDLRRRLGAANRERAERSFDEREMLGRYETLFAPPDGTGAASPDSRS